MGRFSDVVWYDLIITEWVGYFPRLYHTRGEGVLIPRALPSEWGRGRKKGKGKGTLHSILSNHPISLKSPQIFARKIQYAELEMRKEDIMVPM